MGLCLAVCRPADSPSVEADVSPDLSIEQGSELPPLKNTTERKLMAKIDLYILPMLSILYLLAFLDRYHAPVSHCCCFFFIVLILF